MSLLPLLYQPRLLLFPALLFSFCSVSLAQTSIQQSNFPDPDEPFAPNIKPSLFVTPSSGGITIDGQLDDPGWSNASVATNFAENFPDQMAKPPIEMKGYLTFDETHLYAAFEIWDDPDAIRANFSDRDEIWNDDYVGLILDINNNGREMYFIASNPLGIQGDTRISPNNEDLGFDVVYKSEGRITDSGYIVEMAIPFRSLRFPDTAAQSWRATFWITHPRDSRNQYTWSAINPDEACWPCQFGTFEGMEGVRSAGNIEILPALTGAQSASLRVEGDPNSGLDNGKLNADPSLNVKYGITSSMTADFALNPDFSQIEADVAQIDVNSTFALFFPERRPFFQEGADQFSTYLQTVYTRSINDPIAASKFTGRFGDMSVAYIGARDNTSPLLLPFEERSDFLQVGKSYSNILRVVKNFSDESFIGGLVTDRRLDEGGSGTVFSLDGNLRLFNKYALSGQWATSITQEMNDPERSETLVEERFGNNRYTSLLDGESFSGTGYNLEFGRNARHWNFEFEYEQLSPTFRADNGFIRQNNSKEFFGFQSITLYPKSSFLDRIQPYVYGLRTWNFDNTPKLSFIAPSIGITMKGQTYFEANYQIGEEQFNNVLFTGLNSVDLFINSSYFEWIRLGGGVEIGKDIARNLENPEIGDMLDIFAFGTIRPTSRLNIQPRFNYSRLSDLETGETFFKGYIARARVNYQFTRRLFLRTVFQYNDFSESFEVDPLLTYRINPFSAFYIGSTHDYFTLEGFRPGSSRNLYQSQRQFFFKFQYLFRT